MFCFQAYNAEKREFTDLPANAFLMGMKGKVRSLVSEDIFAVEISISSISTVLLHHSDFIYIMLQQYFKELSGL